MTKHELDEIKQILLSQLLELESQGEKTALDIRNMDQNHTDPTDQASFDEVMNMKLRIRDRESKLINKILLALERIKQGEFGICETCEEDIPLKRLMARPVTTSCIECKSKDEQKARASSF